MYAFSMVLRVSAVQSPTHTIEEPKKVAIVGGKLQGCEAAFLGKEAGIKITLIDINPKAPARLLCDEFVCGDVLSDNPDIVAALDEADMILPTMENASVLQGLVELCDRKKYVLAFDWDAYKITSSKKASDSLFAELGLPCPKYYPEGNLPYISKPDSESGSHGVRFFEEKTEFDKFMQDDGKNYIVQEFIDGPSYSVEVIGKPGNYRTYVPTEIFVDDMYDCNLAAVHRNIDSYKIELINEYITQIAEELSLKGIMDIEVIDKDGSGDIRILEIDARLPSQTSVAVYYASGMNYIEELYDLFCKGQFVSPLKDRGLCSSYTQYLFEGGMMSSHGEHIMVEGGGLMYSDELCSQAKAVTDFSGNDGIWRGIFINWADTKDQLHEKENLMINELKTADENRGRSN